MSWLTKSRTSVGMLLIAMTTTVQAGENARDRAVSGSEQPAINTVDYALLQGIARPHLDAQIRPGARGTVTTIHVQEGDWVTAGDPLVTIDDGVAQAAVAVAAVSAKALAAVKQAEVGMHQAQAELARTQQAFEANAFSEFELEAKQEPV